MREHLLAASTARHGNRGGRRGLNGVFHLFSLCSLWLVFFVVAAYGQSTQPAGGQAAEPGPRYIDVFNGFSLCPPAGSARISQRTPSQIVSWQGRDAKTGAISWTLTINKVKDAEHATDLKVFAEYLAATLKEKEGFAVESAQVIKAAGKDAVDIKGHTQKNPQWFQRQAWVLTDKVNFLVLRMTGPVDQAKALDELAGKVLASVEIVAPAAAKAQREKNLANGREFLKTLTPEKIKAAILSDPQYFLIVQDGKHVGYTWTQERQSTGRSGASGLEVKSTSWLGPGVGPEASFWVAFDRSEACLTTRDEGESRQVEFSKGTITSSITRQGKTTTAPAVKAPQDIYLPQGMEMILFRLFDLSRPQAYSFANYSQDAKAFDVLTVRVIGPEQPKPGQQDRKLVRLELQGAEDQPSDALLVDHKGIVLNIDSQGECPAEIRRVAREKILKAFPDAKLPEASGKPSGNGNSGK